MGLFDFAKGIGKKIFGDDDDAGEKLQEHIESDNPGVQGLNVQVQDGTAVITGEADTPEAMEKAILMAGNALGIQNVDASGLQGPEQTIEVEYYEIKEGDSLWKIAEAFYANGSEYTRIFEANREVIKDPDLIFPGQKIRIPKD